MTRRPASPRQRSPDARRAGSRPHRAHRAPGLGTVLAAELLGHVGDVARFPTEHHFASYTGTAPLDASSGKNTRPRLNTGGNRALNSVLHIIASARSATEVAARTTTCGRSPKARPRPRPAGC
ncbi:transposase [Streptomyces aureus]|uniref:Transposase n=1 Tax=Streptomyces aureus TaxID=193461 RepID=A0ABV4SLV2_9ACTN